MDLNISGKGAIVTGGSRGLGRAMALGLADEGCRVVICARGEERLDETVGELKAKGVEAAGVVADMTDPKGAEAVFDAAMSALGSVDILVNNVGGSRGGDIFSLSDDDWLHAFQLNLLGAIRLTKLSLPAMQERRWGRIIGTASIWGREYGGGMTYQVAKSALISFSKALALQVASDGVTVNSVAPGSIAFPGGGWQRRYDSDPEWGREFIKDNLPIGRFGTPDEVASLVVFLASERASLITGASINVDGGQSKSLI